MHDRGPGVWKIEEAHSHPRISAKSWQLLKWDSRYWIQFIDQDLTKACSLRVVRCGSSRLRGCAEASFQYMCFKLDMSGVEYNKWCNAWIQMNEHIYWMLVNDRIATEAIRSWYILGKISSSINSTSTKSVLLLAEESSSWQWGNFQRLSLVDWEMIRPLSNFQLLIAQIR